MFSLLPFFFLLLGSSTASKSTSSTSVNRHRRHRLADLDDVDLEAVEALLWRLWKNRLGGCVFSAFGVLCFLPCLHHVINCQTKQTEAAEELGQFVLAEFLFAGDADFVAGARGYKHPDTAFLVDDVVALEDVEGAQDGVGVHLVLGSQVADAGHALVFLILAGEDVVAHAVGYLHVDGSLVLVNHRVTNL